MNRRIGALALLVTSLTTVPAFAGGFLVYDLSGEAIGRASAVSADVSEPAQVWFNPAALGFMDGMSASAGAVFLTARSHFTDRTTGRETSSERGNFVLPSLFAEAKVHDRVALGLGVYSAFGIGIGWPRDWQGRENAIAASLETVSVNPNVAVRLEDHVSLAAGFDAVRSTVDFETGLPAVVGGQVRIVGGTWGYGFNAAALVRVVPERLQLGLTYRSRVKLVYDGMADFQPRNPDFSRALPDGPGRASITLPDIITLGVLGRPNDGLTLSVDANVVVWSTYDRIDLDFRDAPDRALHPDGHTSFTLRAGVDYATLLPGFHVRGGLIYDRTALPDSGMSPGLPDANRIDLALGVGHSVGPFKADLGYLLVNFLPAEARGGLESPEGTYRTLAHLVGLTLGIRLWQ